MPSDVTSEPDEADAESEAVTSEPDAESDAASESSEPSASAESAAESASAESESEPREAESDVASAEPTDAEAEAPEPSAASDTGQDLMSAPMSSEDESEAKATTATKQKTKRKTTGKAEKFEVNAFGTLEEHVAICRAAKCGTCKFWKRRWEWSSEFACHNPLSQKNETWLGFKNGFAVCLICAADKEAVSKTKLGKGVGGLWRPRDIRRHARSGAHMSAQQAWQERLRAEATQGASVSICNTATAASATIASATSIRTPDSGCRAVVAARALLEKSEKFHSLDIWFNALCADQRQALESPWHCKRLVGTMARHEKALTHDILREGAVFRLQADGLERTYQVEIGTVLWSMPASLDSALAHGVQGGWLEKLGPRGPWIVERIIGMQQFPQEMDGEGKAAMLEACVRRACLTFGGDLDTKLHQHVRDQTRVWCSDGADLKVPWIASAYFPGLAFLAWDEAHSAQKVCQGSLQFDPEVVKADKLLVTGKRPYSIAKFLSTSQVFKQNVGDKQWEADIAFVENFGWAPQRFTSRAKPFGRLSRRWGPIFDALTTEANGKSVDRRKLARMYRRLLKLQI